MRFRCSKIATLGGLASGLPWIVGDESWQIELKGIVLKWMIASIA